MKENRGICCYGYMLSEALDFDLSVKGLEASLRSTLLIGTSELLELSVNDS